MKTIQVECFLQGQDKLHADSEESIILYGNDYNYLEDLAKYLSFMAPDRLFVLGHFYSYEEEPFIITAFFNGEELYIDEDGSYYKYEGYDRYRLVDTADGLELVYIDF